MKKIPLSQGLFALVDDEDFEKLSKYKWRADRGNSTFYAARLVEKGRNIRMHRQILGVTDPKMDVDHKNGNGIDNRRSNLRVCSRSLNNANRAVQSNSGSGIKGVFWDKERNKWQVKIGYERKVFNLGRFSDLTTAVKAYNDKAKELFGDFARLNDI